MCVCFILLNLSADVKLSILTSPCWREACLQCDAVLRSVVTSSLPFTVHFNRGLLMVWLWNARPLWDDHVEFRKDYLEYVIWMKLQTLLHDNKEHEPKSFFRPECHTGTPVLLFSSLSGHRPSSKFEELCSLTGCCFKRAAFFHAQLSSKCKPARPCSLASTESIVNAV